jgi:hypothetical protein
VHKLMAIAWGMLAAGLAQAAFAEDTTVQIEGVPSGFALEVVVDGANGSKTVTMADGVGTVAADFMNDGKLFAVYVEKCENGKKVRVSVVEDGELPPQDNEDCDREVIAGLRWRRGGRLVIDAAKGTAVVRATQQPEQRASKEAGSHTGRNVGIGVGLAAIAGGALALASGGSDAPELQASSFNGRWNGAFVRATAQAAACGLTASAPDGFVEFTAGNGNAATAVYFNRITMGTWSISSGALTYRGSGTGSFPSGRTFTNQVTFTAREDNTGTAEEIFTIPSCPEPIVYRADLRR